MAFYLQVRFMPQQRPIENHVSAGGVVHRTVDGRVEVAICGRSSPIIWALPKGTPDPGETLEQTALREVNEETGLQVELEAFIDSIDYWFVSPSGSHASSDGIRVHKTVHFYLMRPTGGSIDLHDPEFDLVEWQPASEALERLIYPNEVRIVSKGLSMVAARAGAT